MEAKINIAEILKDKPLLLKFYSTTYGRITFNGVHKGKVYFFSEDTNAHSVKPDGKMYDGGECIIFPSREMRNWSKFAWKRGNILVSNDGGTEVIFDKWYDDTYTSFYCKHYLNSEDKNKIVYYKEFLCTTEKYFLEDKNAAQTYINTIEERLGGKLNRGTLEVEKAQPEFKDGDIVFMKGIKSKLFANCIFILGSEYKDGDERAFYYAFYNADDKFTIAEHGNTRVHYSLRPATDSEKQQLFDALAKKGKAWDAEKKQIVDIKKEHQFKPFEKVLVRDSIDDVWRASFFSHIKENDGRYVTTCVTWKFCIPYIGNESLLGTTKDVEG